MLEKNSFFIDYEYNNTKERTTLKKINIRIFISILLFFTLAAPSYSKGVYILCYHAFLEKKDPYTIAPDQLKEQLKKLKDKGFNFVTFDDVINDRLQGSNNILLTIDDGNHSVYQVYYSILKPMGIKPVLGIYPAVINRMKYAMTWEQVQKLADDGCYIASHGYHHMFLSTKYYNEDPISFKKEIYLSKKILEEKLNRKIETMLYPFGVNSDIAINEMKNAGYKYGLTIEPKMESLPVNNNFQIHRYLMTKVSQKGFIASIIKNASSEQAESIKPAVNSTPAIDEKNKYDEEKITITNYPEKIKKIISSGLIILPADSGTVKKAGAKFKPFIHPAGTAAESKSKKITAKNEKKNHRKKKTV